MPFSGSEAKPELNLENTYLKNFEEVSSLFSRKIPAKNGLKNISIIRSENPISRRNSCVVLSLELSRLISYPLSELLSFKILILSPSVDISENKVPNNCLISLRGSDII